MQVTTYGKLRHATVWLTPQRAGFNICGAAPAEITFLNRVDGMSHYVSLTKKSTSSDSQPKFLPCPGWYPTAFTAMCM